MGTLFNTQFMSSLPSFPTSIPSSHSTANPCHRPEPLGPTSSLHCTHLAKPQSYKMQIFPHLLLAAECSWGERHYHDDCTPFTDAKYLLSTVGGEGENSPPLTTPTSPIALSPF